jgi:oligopeptide/dipeptide ABC transporter ATP-binding protein
MLEVRELVVELRRDAASFRVADGLSFSLSRGEVVGLVGESGSGKSMSALALFRLLPPGGRILAGSVRLDGVELLELSQEQMRRQRGAGLAYVPQEPGEAWNPVITVGSQIVDVIRAHRRVPRAEARRDAVAALARVGIPDPERRAGEYAHQFSGGMRQRALVAMALAARPKVLVADEPTTALDATLQAGVLDLLRRLAEEDGLGVLLITHDLAVVAAACSRVLVMYAGRIVEEGAVEELFARPLHPYTRALLAAVPRPGLERGALPAIPGAVPDLARLPSGCPFHPRCPAAIAACSATLPALEAYGRGRRAACLRVEELVG